MMNHQGRIYPFVKVRQINSILSFSTHTRIRKSRNSILDLIFDTNLFSSKPDPDQIEDLMT